VSTQGPPSMRSIGTMHDSVSVLVVGGPPDSRSILLPDLGITPHYALHFEEGIQRYLDIGPEILVLDTGLPEKESLELVRYVRVTANDPDTYILCLANAQVRDLSILHAGANDLLVLPCPEAELVARFGVAQRQIILNRQLKGAYRRIAQEMEAMASIQEKMLPKLSPAFPGVRVSSLYRPSGHASGDYYDHFPLDRNTLRVVVADVSGHGGRAAFLMGIVRTVFRMSGEFIMDLGRTIATLNLHLLEILGEEGDFVSLIAADIEIDSGRIRYCNAGHCPGLVRRGQAVQTLPALAPVIGFFQAEYPVREVAFPRGSTLFFYTDGLYEWEVAPGRQLGIESFLDLATETMLQGEFTLEMVMETMKARYGANPPFRDDLTGLVVQL
jgi:phosphoserine phosphatase RsbU/P